MELIEAIRTLRDECIKYDYCEECPLRTYDNKKCMLHQSTPDAYTLVGDKVDKTPRIFI